jgi:hypothetical protein
MAGPATYDLELYQGDPFDVAIRLESGGLPVPLSGFPQIAAQIRPYPASPEVLQSFAVTPDPVQDNRVILSLDGDQVRDLPPVAVWDFQMTDATGRVRTYLAGRVIVNRQVTV